MHDRHAEKLARVLHRLNAALPAQVIPLGQPRTMLDVRDALARGEIVALLADRSMHGDRQVSCPFLGGAAGFPRGPFELAALLNAPVMLFSATWRSRMRYDVRFEALASDDHGAAGRDVVVAAGCVRFAAWLDARCRAAPYNWFNFYDFWASGEDREP
jgi:predicted LPLAT superfamily acyltransferase